MGFNAVPAWVNQQIGANFRYIKNIKAAEAAGTPVNYGTGKPLAVESNNTARSGYTDNRASYWQEGFLQGYLNQQFPQYSAQQAASQQQPSYTSPRNGSIYQNQFSSSLWLDASALMAPLMLLRAMLEQQQARQAATETTDDRSTAADTSTDSTATTGYTDTDSTATTETTPTTTQSAPGSRLAAMQLLRSLGHVNPLETGNNTDSDTLHYGDTDYAAIQSALTNQQVTPRTVGQALMTLMRQSDTASTDEYQQLTTRLLADGTLNPRTLFNGALRRMPAERQAVVSQAIADAGLNPQSNASHSGFSGYLLQHLNNANKPDLQRFSRDLTFRLYHTDAAEPNTLALMRLAGFPFNTAGQFVADANTRPFELKAYL